MTVTLELSDIAADVHTRRALSEISLSVAKGKRIVVVTGAGISCSCGIPDFRSSDGLYALVKQQYPDVVLKGRDLFDASLFRDATSTAVFYTFISQLKRSIDAASPTPTHHFIKTLDSKRKLLRSYTQNIDGLEARAGLLGTSCQDAKASDKSKTKIRTKDVRNVQLHGDIHRVRCVSCSAEYPCTEEHVSLFNQGTPPDCPECLSRAAAREARSARPIRVGSLRPAIVLYDEPHPLGDDIGAIQSADVARKPDMLIIMGTSLKVHGLKKLVKEFAKTIHASASPSAASSSKKPPRVIFVNKTPPAPEWADIIDYHVAGETDQWVTKVIEDWKKSRPADWEVQQTLIASSGGSGGFKTVQTAIPLTTAKDRKKDVKKKVGAGIENIAPPSSGMLPSKDGSLPIRDTIAIVPPLSPSKRRQASSHYNDNGNECSPSKRRGAASLKKHVMPVEERKLLFAETTNSRAANKPPPLDIPSEMDCSIADLSMRDVQDVIVVKRAAPKKTISKPKTKAVKPRTVTRRAATSRKVDASKAK